MAQPHPIRRAAIYRQRAQELSETAAGFAPENLYGSFANTRGRTNKKRGVPDIFALVLLSVPIRISPAPPFTRAKITGSPDHVFIGFIPT